jgi:hypothetical protein
LDHRVSEHQMTGAEILQKIEEIGCRFVEFTGGEPLEQPAVIPLMQLLCDQGYEVAVETGGHIDTQAIDPRVITILDVKCPDSKMDSLNHLDNLTRLRPHDEVKFVLARRITPQVAHGAALAKSSRNQGLLKPQTGEVGGLSIHHLQHPDQRPGSALPAAAGGQQQRSSQACSAPGSIAAKGVSGREPCHERQPSSCRASCCHCVSQIDAGGPSSGATT